MCVYVCLAMVICGDVYNVIVSMKDKLFVWSWACYLKRKGLIHPDVVLTHLPNTLNELVFILEVTLQLLILKKLQSYPQSAIKTIVEHPLAPIALDQHLTHTIHAQYLQGLITRFYFLTSNQPPHQPTTHLSLLVYIASLFLQQNQNENHQLAHRLLSQSSILFYLLAQNNQHNIQQTLTEYTTLWTSNNIATYIHQDLFQLFLVWQYHQLHISEQQSIQQQNAAKTSLQSWFLYIKFQLQLTLVNNGKKKLSVLTILHEAKVILGLSSTSKQTKRQTLITLKRHLFQRSQNNLKICQGHAYIFGYLFGILNFICQQFQESIQKIIKYEDILKNEFLLYFHQWNVLALNQYEQNLAFLQFMRKYSQVNVLQIYSQIYPDLPNRPQQFNKHTYESYLKTRHINALNMFFYQPYTVAKATLQYYVKESGISLQKNTKLKTKQNRFSFEGLYYDPLHYLMIDNRFWNNHYHRAILQLSLWITLDCYSKEISLKGKGSLNQNQYQEYLKKLNLAITIFLFSLDFPTKMLQYHPVESDTLKDLFIQPIFPALILKNNYFFKDYDWQKQQILQKSQTGIDYWVLPWSHLLGIPKNMSLYIYFEEGYKLAHNFVLQQRINFDKIFGDFFTSKITSQLQMLGISLNGQQAQIKQKLGFLNGDRKKAMYLLLKQNQSLTEKSKIAVKKLLLILA